MRTALDIDLGSFFKGPTGNLGYLQDALSPIKTYTEGHCSQSVKLDSTSDHGCHK